jgi:hypothetical protein
MDEKSFLTGMASAFKITIPARYEQFIAGKEYLKYEESQAVFTGFISGLYHLHFMDELLTDIIRLGKAQGIKDIKEIWSKEFTVYIPLAYYDHPEVPEPKGFLVWDSTEERMPVLIFDFEGPRVYGVADSLEQFIQNFPDIHNKEQKSRNAAELAEKKFEFWKKGDRKSEQFL